VTGTGVPAGAFVGKVTNAPVMAMAPVQGGGDTGSVLISPYIRPRSISNRYYNHYSWLRTMEDLFSVARHSRGLDRKGHLGYAAQPGLAPFGLDVFNDPRGHRVRAAGAQVGGVLHASRAHPALAIQGDTVSVRVGLGRALATAVGPTAPSGTHGPAEVAVAASFTVTIAERSRAVPLRAGDFTAIDGWGQTRRLTARFVARHPQTRLTLSGQLPVGQGELRWSVGGVSWDYDLELR
jgi:hypothetical protein